MPRLLGLLIFLTAALYILFFSPFFKIKSAEVIGADTCVFSTLFLEEFNLIGKNLLTFSKRDLESRMLSKYSCIKKVTINKIFPAKLKLEVESQSAILKIADANLFLTQDGTVAETASISQLPILYSHRNLNLKVGEKVQDETIAYVLNLTDELSKSDFTAASLRIIDQESIAVYNTADLVVIFSAKKPVNVQVDSLQLVLSKAKIDAAKISKIDLRFEKPVLVFK